MNVTYRTINGRLTFDLKADSTKVLFEEIAAIEEVFGSDVSCGICKSTNIRPSVRTPQKYKYYELVCQCGARFEFGQLSDDAGLFPKREGPNGGWSVYAGNVNGQGHSAPPQQQQPHHATTPQRQREEYIDYSGPVAPPDVANQGHGNVWPGPGKCRRCYAPEGKPHGRQCMEAR